MATRTHFHIKPVAWVRVPDTRRPLLRLTMLGRAPVGVVREEGLLQGTEL